MIGDSGLLNKRKRLSDENVQLVMICIIMKCEISAHKNNAIVFCITFKLNIEKCRARDKLNAIT
jgi:hypothetical protein